MVDEYRLMIYPIVGGGGKRLFRDRNPLAKLGCTRVHAGRFRTGSFGDRRGPSSLCARHHCCGGTYARRAARWVDDESSASPRASPRWQAAVTQNRINLRPRKVSPKGVTPSSRRSEISPTGTAQLGA
jgi:hypothetical protein